MNLKRSLEPSKDTERGELMQYFRQRLNTERVGNGYPLIQMARMGKILEKIPTKDLYYLKRICDDSKNFSKKFWWEINPTNFKNGVPIEKPSKPNKMNKRQKIAGIKPKDFVW